MTLSDQVAALERELAALRSATPAQSSGAVVPPEVVVAVDEEDGDYVVSMGHSGIAWTSSKVLAERWAHRLRRRISELWPQVPAAGEVEKLRHQRDVARACVNTDMTHLARALVEVVKRARGFTWIADGESGSHTYDEDERAWLREEIGHALEQIIGVATDALRMSGNIAAVAFEDPLFPKPSAPAAGEVPPCVACEQIEALRAGRLGNALDEAESLCNAILAAGLAETTRLRSALRALLGGDGDA